GLVRVHPGGKGLEMRQDTPDGPVAPGAAPRGCQRLLEVLLKRARQAGRPGLACAGRSLPQRADTAGTGPGRGAGPVAMPDSSFLQAKNTGRPTRQNRRPPPYAGGPALWNYFV